MDREYWVEEGSETDPAFHLAIWAAPDGSQHEEEVLLSEEIMGGQVEQCVRRVSVSTWSRDQGSSASPLLSVSVD